MTHPKSNSYQTVDQSLNPGLSVSSALAANESRTKGAATDQKGSKVLGPAVTENHHKVLRRNVFSVLSCL